MTDYAYSEERAELIAELERERSRADDFERDCEEMAQRLSRLDDHLRDGPLFEILRKLADYAGGFIDYKNGLAHESRDAPPPDPFPEPTKPKRRSGGKRQ